MKLAPSKKPKTNGKYSGHPLPVRLEPTQEGQVSELAKRVGIPKASVIRAGLGYVLPRMLSGEINPFEKKAA